jgi:hypothetical protein
VIVSAVNLHFLFWASMEKSLDTNDVIKSLIPSIFRIEVEFEGKAWAGTGFTIAKLEKSNRLFLATAKHVIDIPDDASPIVKVQQYDEFGKLSRNLSFQQKSKKDTSGRSAFHTHNTHDIGVLILPSQSANDQEIPARIISPEMALTIGTKISWAGFPGIVEASLGRPQLCYFEGVVSAFINEDNRMKYIVDGHCAEGVSGGPVWYFNDEKNRHEIVGVVSAYEHWGKGIPGFCIFEPINSVLLYLRSEQWHPDKIGEWVILNCYG